MSGLAGMVMFLDPALFDEGFRKLFGKGMESRGVKLTERLEEATHAMCPMSFFDTPSSPEVAGKLGAYQKHLAVTGKDIHWMDYDPESPADYLDPAAPTRLLVVSDESMAELQDLVDRGIKAPITFAPPQGGEGMVPGFLGI